MRKKKGENSDKYGAAKAQLHLINQRFHAPVAKVKPPVTQTMLP
jgi:hypothetical protein